MTITSRRYELPDEVVEFGENDAWESDLAATCAIVHLVDLMHGTDFGSEALLDPGPDDEQEAAVQREKWQRLAEYLWARGWLKVEKIDRDTYDDDDDDDDDGDEDSSCISVHDIEELRWLRGMCANGTARRMRVAMRISLTEASAAASVGKGSLSRWERGLQSPHGPGAVRYERVLRRLVDGES